MARRSPVVLLVTLVALVAGSCNSGKLGPIRSSDATDASVDRVPCHFDGAAERTTVDGTTVDETPVDAAVEVRPAADAAATCTGLALGAVAPPGACPEGGPASCGFDGKCDGAGGCHRYPAGTVCAAPSCLDAATFQPPSACDGQGICVVGPAVTCSPYTCVNDACDVDDCKFRPEDCLLRPNRDASPG